VKNPEGQIIKGVEIRRAKDLYGLKGLVELYYC